MSMSWLITTLAITAFFSSSAYAYDLHPLQDICVADNDSSTSVFVNGKVCKDPKLAKADDFFLAGCNASGNAIPGFVNVNTTFGISLVGVLLESQGLIRLHSHPRASEIITILKGTVYAGFLVPDVNVFKSRLFSKILNPSDVFAIPQGLINFLYNVGHENATFLGSFNNQNPGTVSIPDSIFGSDPPILVDVLARGFQLDKKVIEELQKKFS